MEGEEEERQRDIRLSALASVQKARQTAAQRAMADGELRPATLQQTEAAVALSASHTALLCAEDGPEAAAHPPPPPGTSHVDR